ncbi:pitrilysin family protein [Actibacterium sp. 188UL27-1]|uniref:M16 family metallopeptidase n=1 Tax=Actibacterium sp. 188UL27-1 TaxID=2786961 RepID=UPI00195F0FDB|nr:pitrilysin family protein [Actibacterium sp. 188UL27-1]MBM7068506.1 insulinase family protein [Actibacterium sp. 188UL27-1]
MFGPFFRAVILSAAVVAPNLTQAAEEGVTTFSLENGMDVVVIADDRAPVVVHMVWYRVGAADEAPGQSGIAHFLEHLLFKGTESLAPGEFSDIVEQNGGSDNAFTSWDYTGYFQRVAADRLDLMMKMEADRMQNLVLTEDVVLPERNVILEERNQRTDNSAGALFNEQQRAAQYMNHPYGRPIIGWRHEMETLSLQDALDFYELHYAPNNAILVVAGDITADEVRALAETHYGPIEANPAIVERARPSEPPQLAERRLRYSDPRVSQDYLVRSYLAPERDPGAQEKAAALVYLADLLGGSSATSVMGQKLEFESRNAVYTSAFYDGLALDETAFGLVVVPVPGRSLEEAEQDLDQVLAEFMADGIDTDQFERIQTQIKAGQIYALDSLQGRASRYGEGLTAGLTVEDVQAWPDVLQAVTPEDVMTAAAELFDRDRSVTGFVTRAQEVTQ